MREKTIVEKYWIVAVPPHPAPSSQGMITPGVRLVRDLSPVLMEPIESEEPAYWMYRGFGYPAESLRLDLTIMRSGTLGKEFIKTFGHVHPRSPWSESYGEVYKIMRGEAIMVLQRDNIVKIFKLKEGESIYIPPGWGHVTVNVGHKMLEMVNLVASDFKSDYNPYKERRGAAVYVTIEGIIPNPRYLEEYGELTIYECRSLSPPLEWWVRHHHLGRCLRTGACLSSFEVCESVVKIKAKKVIPV